ncbi:hypothetical protein F5Y11DRAFT_346593 [Daldinia sp. FL1419]|nr:hypothetical protein F5Y11DRAFT_346593 [Daldinia sp. FL1419]
MSANNNDSVMTRFLFAILKQKNLKDINWDAVAKDEVLASPITNGHAARMRFSRFRSAMLGNEPTKRNRTTQGKNRVTKARKNPKAKNGEHVKFEAALETYAESSMTPEPSEMPAPRIKEESVPPYGFDDRFTPRLTPAPSDPIPSALILRNNGVIQPRFLTPGSDNDLFSPSPTITSSSASEMITTPGSFGFRDSPFRNSPCPERPDPMWPSVPHYASTSFDEFRGSPREQPQMHSHTQMLPCQTVEPDNDCITVKHEWEEF